MNKNFFIKDVFEEISIAKSFDKNQLNQNGQYPFVGRSSSNNGLQCYSDVSPEDLTKGNCITISMVGTFKAFWQPKDFIASQNILVLRNKYINFYSALYLCTVLNVLLEQKYTYNRPIQKNKFINEIINLPAKNNKPDIEFMHNYIKSIYNKNSKNIKTNININNSKLKDLKYWKEFKLSELFDISVSKDENLQHSNFGKTIYIGSSSENNGITGYIDAKPSQKENTITIARNGSVCSTFYQSKPYCSSPDDIRILTPKFNLNVYIALFIKTVIEKEKFKYAYGRKLGTKRIQNLKIKLPSKKDGTVDFEYIENYIKSLPYSDLIK